MSRLGLKVAKLFGKRLPAFSSRAEAEAYLFGERDERLRRLRELAPSSGVFAPDFVPESLKHLERWYFDLSDTDGFSVLGITREEFEGCMASYFCELAVRNSPDTKWEIREFVFEPGKFEIGVQRGLMHLMLRRFSDHYKQPNNKRRQKIFRMYEQRFAA
jgi:hypothetical protein